MKLLLLTSVVVLSACASPTVTNLRSPDGRDMKNVKCNIDAQRCLALASESCKEQGGTYQVVRSHSNSGGTAADIVPGPVTWYNMSFICGPSDGRLPEFAFQGQQYMPAPGPTYTNCRMVGNRMNCTTY